MPDNLFILLSRTEIIYIDEIYEQTEYNKERGDDVPMMFLTSWLCDNGNSDREIVFACVLAVRIAVDAASPRRASYSGGKWSAPNDTQAPVSWSTRNPAEQACSWRLGRRSCGVPMRSLRRCQVLRWGFYVVYYGRILHFQLNIFTISWLT